MCRTGIEFSPSLTREVRGVSCLGRRIHMAVENVLFLCSFRTKDTPKLGLLLVILGVIFMNGNRASEGEWLDKQLGVGYRLISMLIFRPLSPLASHCSCPLGGTTQDGTASWV